MKKKQVKQINISKESKDFLAPLKFSLSPSTISELINETITEQSNNTSGMKLSTTKSVPKSEQDALFGILAPIAIAGLVAQGVSEWAVKILEAFFAKFPILSLGAAAAADATAYGNAVAANAALTKYLTDNITSGITQSYLVTAEQVGVTLDVFGSGNFSYPQAPSVFVPSLQTVIDVIFFQMRALISQAFQAAFELYRLEVAANTAAAKKKFRRYLKWFLVAAVLDITNYNYNQ